MAVVIRPLLVLCTLTWWVFPGMGLIDLSVTWDPDWPVMLEGGWGVLFTVGLGLPFLVAAVAPRLARVALLQLYAVTASLVVGVALGLEWQAWWIFVMLTLEVPLLHVVAPAQQPVLRSPSPALIVLAAVAAPVALTHAWSMAADNRRTLVVRDITNDTDHFAVQAALALTLVLLPVLAGWWPHSRRLLGTSTGVMAAYLGLVSYNWPGTTAGYASAWSVAVMVWAALVLVAAWWPAHDVPVTETDPRPGNHFDPPVRQ